DVYKRQVYAEDAAGIEAKLNAYSSKPTREQARERGLVVGTSNEVVEQLGELNDAGVQRVMLQWLDLEDMDGIERLAKEVLPQLS
ncbi:MAG: LLM class F420-dependent oxidoreductase, partial [Chloroflexi bacterium]|nr:LLM class F420-dependent oxidoreductase [Chloroflexota bacterium]